MSCTPTSPAIAAPKTDLQELKRDSVRGGALTMVGQGTSAVIQICSTVILARLLTPGDYGIMAMATSITAFAAIFNDLGLPTAVIRKKDLTHGQQSNMFWVNLAMGLLLTLLVASISPLVAWFYQKPEVLWVTVTLSASFLINGFGAQHAASLTRQMRFGRLIIANVSGALLALIVSTTLASLGFRHWALVWGLLSGASCTVLLYSLLSSLRPGLPSKESSVREMLKFGAQVTAFDFVNYFPRNLDNLLLGRFWGPQILGLYSRGYSLLMFPITTLQGPVNAVALPALSKLQNEPDAFRSYYRKITSLLAFLSMPLTAFLFVASRPIVELTLGEKWLGVVPIFAILATAGFVQPVSGLRSIILLSTGQGTRCLRWGIFNAVCMSIGFLIGIRWGATGIALSYAITSYVILYPSQRMIFSNTPVVAADFYKPIALPAISSALAVAGILSLQKFGVITFPALPFYAVTAIGLVFASSYMLIFIMLPGGLAQIKELTGAFRLMKS